MTFKDYATKLKEAVKPGLDRTVDAVKRGLTTGPVTASAVAAPPKPNYFGPAVGAAVGGVGAYDAAKDMISNGAGLDNTTDFAGNAALAVGSVLSAPGIATMIPRLAALAPVSPQLAVGGGMLLLGKGVGSAAVELAGNTSTGQKAVDYLAGTDKPLANQVALDQVALENPNGKLAGFRRGLAARDSVTAQAGTAPVTAPTAPAIAAPAAPVVPATQQLTPQEVQGLRSGTINAAQYAPGTAGTGFVINSEGRGTRFNAQPVQTATPELTDPVAIAQAELARQAGGAARFGNKAAREASSLILANDAKSTAASAGLRSKENADEIALREAKRKSIDYLFPTAGVGGKPGSTDSVKASEFLQAGQATLNKRTKQYSDALNNPQATAAQRDEATKFLKAFAQPTQDGGYAPLGVEYLGEPALKELKSFYDLRTRAKELNDRNTSDGLQAGAIGALAGAVAGGKKRGLGGALVGGAAGGIAAGAYRATRRDFTNDDDLFSYAFRPEDPKNPEEYYVSDNGTRLHYRDLATLEGNNPVFPDLFKSRDKTVTGNKNLVRN